MPAQQSQEAPPPPASRISDLHPHHSRTKDRLDSPVPRRRQRTLSSQGRSRIPSPSVQLALADPTLSKSLSSSPAPSRAGSELDEQAHAKRTFEQNVRRYYYQLTVGCQLSTCTNRLCRSCRCAPKMTKDAAAIFSIQLAARPRMFFCSNCPVDAAIDMPDSPLPVAASHLDPQLSSQRRPGALPSRMMAAKATAATIAASRSSPGPAASVEDFSRAKDHRLYEPTEYSKSVPSFSVSHILSPVKSTQTTALSTHSKEDAGSTTTRSTPPLERVGTPLFRSLLSVSPFSTIFSSGSSPFSSAPNHGGVSRSQELPKKRSLSPRYPTKLSASTGTTRLGGGLQLPHQPRSFSPVRSRPRSRSISPPTSPTSAVGNDNKTGSFRIHPFLRHLQHSFPGQSPSLSTFSPPQSPSEKELENRTLYSYARTSLRRDSASSLASEGDGNNTCQWPSQAQPADDTALYGGISSSSSSSSRRSSVSEGEATEVALPYLNLTLLRQAIATYNSSRPDAGLRSSPTLLSYRDFKPPKATSGIRHFESEDEHDGLDMMDNSISRTGREDALDGAIRGLSLKVTNLDSDSLLADEKLAALKSASLDDEDPGFGSGDGREERDFLSLDTRQLSESFSANLSPPSSGSEAGDIFERSEFGSPAHSMMSSSQPSVEGDSTFLLDSLRSVFSSATALGSSFLMKDRESKVELEQEALSSGGANVGGVDLEALRECYEMMIELKPRTIFAIQVTNSIEILLARLELEQELAMGKKTWSEEEMRAVIILLMNPFLFEQPYQESLLRRILVIFTALPDTATLVQWLSCMDEEGMAQLVTLFKMYLSAHFTSRPHGTTHPAICTVKALSILYEANNIGAKRELEKQRRSAIKDAREGKQNVLPESPTTISFKYFYSGVMEAIKFKDEYQIWHEGWDKSESEKPFSYFDYPFLLSPTSKSHILNLDALTQMSAHYEDACVRHALADHAQRLLPDTMAESAREFQKGIRAGSSPYLVLELSRAHLVEEAFDQITKKHADLKKPLKVAFVDVGEEGMDQGGVTKEFFQIMVEKVFDSKFGLFKELEETRSWWFEGALDGSSHVEMSEKDIRIRLVEYELIGILVGLALYNGVILGVRFPSVVYRKLLGWEVSLDSVIDSFPALGHGLEQMLTWTDGDVYDVFMREFEISYEHLGQVTTLPLVPGGENMPVTNDNREAYVRAYIHHYTHEHIRREFEAFQRGFEKICGGRALKLLRPEELELLLCGNSDLDMHDLEANCLYDDGYSPTHTLIREFWEIVHDDLTAAQHKQLLVFVTGSDRVPIRGLKDLLFVIQRNGPDSERLPTALTCFSRLLLPEYATKDKMKGLLVTAIENSNGFGLV
ncbi:hypothetical protein BGZ99_010072 [Dissophora globulifera]|uniref:HECT-type E3 ubiquitin transferase n=1 Tax=Dissophora globulifera TaxID=979702 RepID=A0A9P6R5N4_9FUNG|nr:hypothetical protein BGZ99_010072 [Dissophora globulifera]